MADSSSSHPAPDNHTNTAADDDHDPSSVPTAPDLIASSFPTLPSRHEYQFFPIPATLTTATEVPVDHANSTPTTTDLDLNAPPPSASPSLSKSSIQEDDAIAFGCNNFTTDADSSSRSLPVTPDLNSAKTLMAEDRPNMTAAPDHPQINTIATAIIDHDQYHLTPHPLNATAAMVKRNEEEHNQFLLGVEKRTAKERNACVHWTKEEHQQFLLGLGEFGKGDYVKISKYWVTSKKPWQISSHAQNYFLRQKNKDQKKSNRNRIHDINSVDEETRARLTEIRRCIPE